MNTLFVLQDTSIRNANDQKIFDVLEQLNCNFITFGTIPFTDTITNFTSDNVCKILKADRIVCFSGIKALRLFWSRKAVLVNEFQEPITDSLIVMEKIRKGYFYNEYGFQQHNYAFFDLFLNNKFSEHKYQTMINDSISFNEDRFIKPSSDLKYFSAGILSAGETLPEFLAKQTTDTVLLNHMDFMVITAPVIQETITVEYRNFVIDCEVITGSFYGPNAEQFYENNDLANRIQQFTQKVILKIWDYIPHVNLVIDIAYFKKSDTLKIVEFNCLNCSGVYESNCELLIKKFME